MMFIVPVIYIPPEEDIGIDIGDLPTFKEIWPFLIVWAVSWAVAAWYLYGRCPYLGLAVPVGMLIGYFVAAMAYLIWSEFHE